ncbi:TadE family type IV pilus minor pilin [Planomonospora corallina]|uniref:TadE family type IV pilus minor pilin n=1 Tax=Planomonospora corallina TaxID=1806052 RepID=A0ABV8I6E5_9ACTN
MIRPSAPRTGPVREAGTWSRGSVTAETAAALPALVVVLAAGLWAIAVVGAQLECMDAARTGARAASRGEPLDRVREDVLAVAPAGAWTQVSRDRERVRVAVSAGVRPRWGLSLPEVTVHATAVSAVEPGVEQSGVEQPGMAGESAGERSDGPEEDAGDGPGMSGGGGVGASGEAEPDGSGRASRIAAPGGDR